MNLGRKAENGIFDDRGLIGCQFISPKCSISYVLAGFLQLCSLLF